ncbi:MAG TPA: hypothetical protein VF581_08755 [Flavobacterium sp.]|jgi:hypothetical protein
MRLLVFYLLFISAVVSAQKPIIITIDKIITTDSLSYQRQFTIEFAIKNTSFSPVSFFLDTGKFIPAHGGSGQNAVFYKVFENEEHLAVSKILGRRFPGDDSFNIRGISQDTIQKIIDAKMNEYRLRSKEIFSQSKITLQPGEARNYKQYLLWDFERYQQQDDHEYYIDPKQPHYLELTVIFLRDEYKNNLTKEQFAAFLADKTFISGWFSSEKVAIDFSEK